MNGERTFISQEEANLLDNALSSDQAASCSPCSAPATPQGARDSMSGVERVRASDEEPAAGEGGEDHADSQATRPAGNDLGERALPSLSAHPPPSYPRGCPLRNHSNPHLRCTDPDFQAGSRAQLAGHLRARHDGAILPEVVVSSLSLWRCPSCRRYYVSSNHHCRARPQSSAIPPPPPGPVWRFGTPDSKSFSWLFVPLIRRALNLEPSDAAVRSLAGAERWDAWVRAYSEDFMNRGVEANSIPFAPNGYLDHSEQERLLLACPDGESRVSAETVGSLSLWAAEQQWIVSYLRPPTSL